jgi:hypothetical protein
VSVLRRAHGDRQRERRLSNADVPADEHEIASPGAAAKCTVEAREAGRDRVHRWRAIRNGVHAAHDASER